MKSMNFLENVSNGGTVLCLGAHSDDIEIGCGGTMVKLLESAVNITVHWVVLSANGQREEEARNSAHDALSGVENRNILIKTFRNGYFPYVASEIKEYFESLKNLPNPDLIFTHYKDDMHQDHRIVSELTRNTFRDHLLLEYEIPKYDGDTSSPNVFVELEKRHMEKKTKLLQNHFPSQQDKQWFSTDTFSGLARLRGIQCNSRTGIAEAFYCRKTVL